jgi:hypothetical protein
VQFTDKQRSRDLDDLIRLSEQLRTRTAERDALLIRLYRDGVGIDDLAKATGLSPASATSLVEHNATLRTLATIGYEGRDIETFVTEIAQHQVTVVVDVRETPLSRKSGFSKTSLSAALSDVGVGYEHLRGLGNPKENRDAFRAGQTAAIRRFEKRLSGPGAQDMEALRSTVAGERAALLCFERDHLTCHRSSIASALQRSDPALHIVNI